MERLTKEEIASGLAAAPGWQREGQTIMRTFRLPSFAESIKLVSRVASLAEAANHHPDIDIRYRQVHLVLTTHEAEGLTTRDFDLARQINAAQD